ncbi:MAG: hypothetical protein PHX68_01990 [Alphaproteobacteria bacterium]|nr:hypothetical protein [Alphaproteobacteria bacterium]
MQRRSYVCSLVLHIALLSLFLTDVALFSWVDPAHAPPAVLMVDLTKVQIGDKTNLPPEIRKQAPKPAAAPAVQAVRQTAVQTPPAPPQRPQEAKPVKDAAPVIAPAPPKTPVKKEVKSTSARPPGKAAPPSDGLKSLLASVEKIRQPVAPGPAQPDDAAGQEVSAGIAGGTGGSLTQMLTISHRDFIATKLRGCWNADAGAVGAEEVVVEVRASVNRDGRVRDVAAVNAAGAPAVRSLAESAVRAVRICDNLGDDSPFRILAREYPDSYDAWKDLLLRFNPRDGSIM